MIKWAELIKVNQEKIEAALIRQWVKSLDERPGDDLRQHAVELHQDGTVLEYMIEAHHVTSNVRSGKSLLIHQFAGQRREDIIDEHYGGDTQAWIADIQTFYPLDTDTIIDAIIEHVKILQEG
ncbi:hypothetical protein KIAC18_000319 [Sporomusa sphaeroides]|uniref:hypothetical protein n=1 Tax=Sporomusa sphaeroides TaxID=47679 RepID=UPI003DA069CC